MAGPPAGPSRRSVLRSGLLALAGAAGVGGCGTAMGGPGEVREGRLTTEHWPGGSPRWLLALPEAPSATVIALHGYGSDATWWFDPPLAQQLAQDLGVAIVAIDGGNTYWHARADGSDTGAMVLQDLLPAVEATGAPIERLAFTGFSMGGYGALLLATQLPPERVIGVATVSAALFLDAGEAAIGAFDDAKDFARHDIFERIEALRKVPVWLACGASDTFAETNHRLADQLPEAVSELDEGHHDRPYFESHWPRGMDFLATR